MILPTSVSPQRALTLASVPSQDGSNSSNGFSFMKRMLAALSKRTRVYIVSSCASIGGFLFGYQFGVLSGVISMPSFDEDISDSGNMDTLMSVLMAGAVAGALAAGYLADTIGRHGVIGVSITLFIGGEALLAGADAVDKLYAGRAVTGVSIGALSMVIPLYQSEIAPKEMRGRIVSVQQFAITLGICTAYWVDYAVLDLKGLSPWRLALAIPLIPAIIYLAVIYGLPRSPRYLVYKHHDKQALESLAFIRGDGSTNHPDVLMEYIEIKQSIRYEEKYVSKHYCRLFHKGPENNIKRLILGMAVQIFQQLTGANALFMYAPRIFQASGLEGRHSALLANGIGGIINLIFTIPPMIYIDRWGRRPTLIAGSIFCCLCTVIMTVIASVTGLVDDIFINLSEKQINAEQEGPLLAYDAPDNISIGFLVVMYLFIACFAMTWAPAGWIYPTELYSQDVRAQALGLTTAANWLFSFGVTQLTPLMFSEIHWKTFVIYSVLCAISSYVVYKYFPETMGKSLEEIDLIFSGNFNYYDLNVHHPHTAAAALSQLDRNRARNRTAFGIEQLLSSNLQQPGANG